MFYPGVGGIENSIRNIASSLTNMGLDCETVSFSTFKDARKQKKHHYIKREGMYKLLKCLFSGEIASLLYAIFYLKRNFRNNIFFVSRHPLFAFAGVVLKFKKHIYIPPAIMSDFYIGVLNDIKFSEKPLQYVKYHLISKIHQLYERVVANNRNVMIYTFSHNIKSQFENKYKKEAVVSEPGVDHSIFNFNQTIQPKNKISFIYVGRLEYGKNVELLLSAFMKVDNSRFLLNVVGSGALETELKARYQSENIVFLGTKIKGELSVLYNQSDFTILPTYYEGFGQVLIESLCCGTKVIGFDSSIANTAVTQIIENDDYGLPIMELGESGIKSILTKIQAEKLYKYDKERVSKISKSRFSWQSFCKNLINFNKGG